MTNVAQANHGAGALLWSTPPRERGPDDRAEGAEDRAERLLDTVEAFDSFLVPPIVGFGISSGL